MSDDSDAESDGDAGHTMHLTNHRERRRAKLGKHGIELQPCKHVFCGVSPSFQGPRIQIEALPKMYAM